MQVQFMELNQQGISEKVFEEVYKTYFKALHAYAFSILDDTEQAEEMVQQVFLKLWERKDRIEIHSSMQAYLYRSVFNESMNFLKHEKVKQAHVSFVKHTTTESGNNHQRTIDSRELESNIRRAMNQLPEQCRTIFQMSRFEELKYREIADKLQLSVKTIENQMGKALKIMRAELAAFLPVLCCMLTGFIKAIIK